MTEMYWKCPECRNYYLLEVEECPFDDTCRTQGVPLESIETEAYKRCPQCRNLFLAKILQCPIDETDLTRIPIGIRTADTHQEPEEVTYVKRCNYCGAINDFDLCNCSGCGEDISDCQPITREEAESGVPTFRLVSIDEECSCLLPQGSTFLGADETLSEYLERKEYVSGKHAEILVEGNRIWIKDISKTNPITVCNKIISKNDYFELHCGDVVGLGGAIINGEYQEDAAFLRVEIEFVHR